MLVHALLLALGPAAAPPPPTRPTPLLAPLPIQDEDTKAARKALEARAKEAASALEKGLRAKEVNERQAALTDASRVVHPRVIKAMAKALGDKEPDVGTHTMILLGGMDHPDALDALRKHARRAKKALEKDPERRVVLLRSIGLHADPDQVGWLLEGLFEEKDRTVRRAKLYGAARTRSIEAVEAIFGALGKKDPRQLKGTSLEIRTALAWLTGTDQGESPQAWVRWWRENKKGFEVPEKEPKLKGTMLQSWGSFWDEDRPAERQRRRGDRG